jgi:ATP-dependent Clp protease adapter protein ClpS
MLRERFGLTHLRGRHVMFRTHFLGEAVVCEDTFEGARTRMRDAEAAARAAGFPLRFRLATPSAS